jgi:hypothetical protein
VTAASRLTRLVATAAVVLALAAFPARASGVPLGDVSGPHLRVVTHDLGSVPGFERFSYQTGTVLGLTLTAAARADRTVAAVVRRTVAGARHPSGSPCSGGAARCGYFLQRLREHPCITGYVCLAGHVGLLPQGANDGEDWVDTIPLHAATGSRARLVDLVGPGQRQRFVAGVNAGARRALEAGGIGSDPFWASAVTLDDVHAWLPGPAGIHVWFAKFAVAPGSFGVVHVLVPWDTFTGLEAPR